LGQAPLPGGKVFRPAATIFAGLCAVAVLSAGAAEWRLAGSDQLGEKFATAVETYAKRNDTTVRTDFAGSRPGIDALKAGRADCALFFLPPGESPPTEFHSRPIGALVVGVFVGDANSVKQLTLAQLRAIFGQGGVAPARWGDLGGIQAWAERPVAAFAYAPKRSLALQISQRVALGEAGWRAGVTRTDDLGEFGRVLTQSPNGVYVAPINNKMHSWRALAIGAEGKPAAQPTAEEAQSGAYPLRLVLHVGFQRRDAPALLPWLKFLLSDECAEALFPAGILAWPKTERNKLALELEELR
jgi:ABC-type phosphate transport system substrate-binding protein